MNEELYNLLKQIGFLILGALIGAICSACAGIRVFNKKRIQDAKDSFLVFMSQKRGAIDKSDVAGYYEKTKTEIRDEVFRVRPFLTVEQKSCLDSVWVKYDSIIPYAQLNQDAEKNADANAKIASMGGEDSKKPSDILAVFFDEFETLLK